MRVRPRRRADEPRREQQALQTRRGDGGARIAPRGLSPPPRALAQPPHAGRGLRVAREPCRERRQRLGDEHVPVAGLAENARQPLDLGDHRVDELARHERRHEREARAKTPRAHPHLVNPLGVVVGHEPRRVRRDLVQALAGDGRKRVGRGRVGRERHFRRVHRAACGAVAPRGAARSRGPPWNRSSPRPAGLRPTPRPGGTGWRHRRARAPSRPRRSRHASRARRASRESRRDRGRAPRRFRPEIRGRSSAARIRW